MASTGTRSRLIAVLAVIGVVVPGPLARAATAEATAVVSGRAFEDVNANGMFDQGEPPLAGHQLYLFDGAGVYRAQAWTAADGTYRITGLADGTYLVAYAGTTWSQIRHDWAPTTTGSLRPERTVAVQGAATVDFGWRRLTWSSDPAAPISSYTGPTGVRTESFTDGLSATDVHVLLAQGSLIGSEASHTVIRVGLGEITEAPTSIGGSNGLYTTFASVVNISWNAWLDDGPASLFHEYGHSWSLYCAYLVQQDGTFASYLEARGLKGDPRVGTSYQWSPGEMIAEDYRQLFGPPAAQARAQANPEIPPAASVPGLRTFLQGTFFTTPPPLPPPPPPPPPPAPVVSDLRMSPADVTKSGTVSFTLSTAASISVVILDGAGANVRTLVAARSQQASAVSVLWDRLTDGGRRARAGSYRVRVDASASGGTTSATTSFTVR